MTRPEYVAFFVDISSGAEFSFSMRRLISFKG